VLAHRIGVLDDGALVVCDTPRRVRASQDPRVRRLLDTLVTVSGEAIAP
jgi:ABC-type transporter Mla maintaining outer membrane lipid asymmetry ATPase subunit MlaF